MAGNHQVGRQQNDPFDLCLRNQDAVEGVFVYGGALEPLSTVEPLSNS
jgi:hypothetical protein